ncbi:hypothetical protein SAMN05216268_106395 [Streptomyces yunnanensis]|uniref:Uncharacterized protein n=1 Tax=Streptomyces yunnanensis TaxID=156453 RepID=A0A9X8MUA0_9ACTN|nr:hypothetical protein SAMN05216268_106395 [Streptomyces yunnanensis]
MSGETEGLAQSHWHIPNDRYPKPSNVCQQCVREDLNHRHMPVIRGELRLP